MEFKLGQKVKYQRRIQKITKYIEEEYFNDAEIVRINKIKMVELSEERFGFIVGIRNIAKKAEYTFEDDDPDERGHIVHHKTETIKVYKVAFDMAHTNFVLGKDLEEVIT